MRVFRLALAALAVTPSTATFVVQCTSRLIDERADPLINPNQVSDHVHVIAGSNGFNFNVTYDQLRASTCSTCNIKEDLSNYWTPKLYFQAQNGSFISVPINGDDALGNQGGMAIYYLPRGGPDNDQLHPFPAGFRMFAGDPLKRNDTQDFAGQAIRHRCVGGIGEFTNLPDKVCPQGVRTEVTFPSCWDGVNLDSPDHKSHMSYPADGNYDGGRCPSTHPVHMLTLFYEVTYRTDQFEWYSNQQPFVLSNGDPTGYSYHGDFISGWDVPTLSKAIADCPDGSTACDSANPGGSTVFTFNTPDDRQACKLTPRIQEQVSGLLQQLPGCNPVSLEPVVVESCPRNPTLQQAGALSLASPTISGWNYLGCGIDDPISWGSHALIGAQQHINAMTIPKCVSACSAAGYSYAGLEFASECYCGNTLDQRAVPKAGILGNCNMKCAGDATTNCGGSKAITIYQKCAAGGCTGVGANTGASIQPAPESSLSSSSSAPSSSEAAISPSSVSFGSSSSATLADSTVALPTNNDAITGGPIYSQQSTFVTVPRPGVTSKSSLHTRLVTTVITSVLTETYWAR